jgi:transposase-like protein
MTVRTATKTGKAKCPCCNVDATYRYGHIKNGQQRFICLMCGTQFTPGARKFPIKGKPSCPECGRPMNVYKLEGDHPIQMLRQLQAIDGIYWAHYVNLKAK